MVEALNMVDVREPHEHEEFNIGGIHVTAGRRACHADR